MISLALPLGQPTMQLLIDSVAAHPQVEEIRTHRSSQATQRSTNHLQSRAEVLGALAIVCRNVR